MDKDKSSHLLKASKYVKVGKIKKAVIILRAYLEELNETFGKEYPDCLEVADICDALGDIYAGRQKYQEAIVLYMKSYKINLKLLGTQH